MKSQTISLGGEASLTAYLWEDSAELAVLSRPAVLVIPGGGYIMCSDREAEPIALAYAAEGFQAFVLRYTVRQGFEAPFREAKAALSLLHEHAEVWHIGKGQLAVCGFSAGGHLAAALGTLHEGAPDAMILGYPAVMGKFWKAAGFDIPDLVERVHKGASPAFLFACEDDAVVPVENVLSFADALRRCEVPFEAHIFRRGGHGVSLAKLHTSSGGAEMVNPRAEDWFPLSVSWLKETVGDVAFMKKPTLPEGLSPAFEERIGVLMQNEQARAALLSASGVFADQTVLSIIEQATLSELLLSLGIPEEQIMLLSARLDEIFPEKG